MKRYLIFQFDKYYPCGGFHDFVNAHETLEEAIEQFDRIVNKLNKEFGGNKFHFCHILDIEKLEIVKTNEDIGK